MENDDFLFEKDKKGVWYLLPASGDTSSSRIWICSPLEIVAVTRDQNGENHGRLLRFYDSDNVLHEWSMAMELLATDGAKYRKTLLSMGLQIGAGTKAKNLLTTYIQTQTPDLKMRCVDKVGWFKNSYVFPDHVITSETSEKIIFQAAQKQKFNTYKSKGSLREWQENVSFYCADNSRLSFSIGTSFASVLLNLLGEESGGINLKGPSSIGKTTALKIAGSVFGSNKMIQSWRSTSNGLEAIAALHNNNILCLDEMGQMSSKEVGEVAYMLANNSGKNRANIHSYARKKQEWNLLFLSTGEIGLADHLKQARIKAKAGQEIRVVDISAKTGEFGIFEELHGVENGNELSRLLTQNTQKYYGTAGRAFIEMIIKNPEEVKQKIKEYSQKFIAENKPLNADGQVLRVLQRFALIAAAGHLATEWKITNWPPDEAFWGASVCFHSWIENRGGTSAQETQKALLQIRHYFELHGESRFSTWDEIELEYSSYNTKTFNRSGYRRTIEGIRFFYVFQEAFKNDICDGIDPKLAADVCIEKGWLVPDSGGKATRAENLPCSPGNTRCYRFNGNKIFSDEINNS